MIYTFPALSLDITLTGTYLLVLCDANMSALAVLPSGCNHPCYSC